MGLLFALLFAYFGAPLGVVFILMGAAFLFFKKRRAGTILLVIGIPLVLIGVIMFKELASVNFGL